LFALELITGTVMILEFGNTALAFAWLLSLLGMFIGALAGATSRVSVRTAKLTTYGVALFSLLSLLALAYGFLKHEYVNQYIWAHSDRSMSWIYKITAIWGGMDGSMLLWATILACAGAIAVLLTRLENQKVFAWTMAVINSSSFFFLTICLFLTNAFRYIKADFIPVDGNGLNPLLQNPYMAIHPPTLYFGFTLASVPFAFCLGALLAGSVNNDWISATRRWSLVAWAFLTAGIVLGGHWAYLELGWGGFWAWDPVENSSFLPWLTATAFIHSVMVQERRGMLKIWNVGLVAGTYLLTVFGTFLTRSGVVQSVHAFASTDIGWIFLLYLGIMASLTIFLLVLRRAELTSTRTIESVLSRETFFLLNNLIFLSICFATLWGVMFPVLSEAVTGQKQAVGIPYFNAINVPLFLLMLLFMAVGPLVAWSKSSPKQLLRTFLWPAISALLIGIVLLWAGVRGFYPITAYCLVWFAAIALLFEMHRSLRVKNEFGKATYGASLKKHRIRFAGYLVHIGVLVAVIGITASMAHKIEEEFSLALGETYSVGRFKLELNDVHEIQAQNYAGLTAKVEARIAENNQLHAVLAPELRSYVRNNESTTEVALRMSLRDDLYLVLAGLDDTGTRATFKVFVNPLQIWLWIGSIMMIIGTAMVVIFRGAKNNAATN
jgi:cytochrome c-type biogenesis protein CcmF